MLPSFSIIICTCNPALSIFQRLLNALLNVDQLSPVHEIIFVDNNSFPALAGQEAVKSFLTLKGNAVAINETQPGLTSARMAGIRQAKYDWLIFFDDDNEPAANYLSAAAEIIAALPQVGAWGPGIVEVEYPNPYYENKFGPVKDLFQIRSETSCRIANEKWWQDCYPAGTGLIIKKEVGDAYSRQVAYGNYNLSDRKGKSLSSGGDLQMVLTAIKMGFFAGVSPALKMNHIIGKQRLSIGYLRRLAFGTAAANVPGHIQVWGLSAGEFQPPLYKDILKQIYFHVKVKMAKDGFMKSQISLCAYLGSVAALYQLNSGVKPSRWWKWTCKILSVN